MRRLVLLTALFVALLGLSIWLVLPMFVMPAEGTLDECDRCASLLALVPGGTARLVVIPRGGSTLFELGRRVAPDRELTELLPAPGLLAIGLGGAPVVGWQDDSGRFGAAAAPSGLRRVFLRVATHLYGGSAVRWSGDAILVGTVDSGGGPSQVEELKSFTSERGHAFAVHASPAGRSVARLTGSSLEIRTYPSAGSSDPLRIAQHPDDAVFSLAVARLGSVVGPIEKVLPLKTGQWADRGGQVVVYAVEAGGLLPRIHGLVLVDGEVDAKGALEAIVPRVEGATIDSTRRVGDVQVYKRETLGVAVEAAIVEGRLAVAFDSTSMDRWLMGKQRPDPTRSEWSFYGDPAALADAVDELSSGPGSYLLSRSARRALLRLRAAVVPFGTARVVRSMRVEGPEGAVIESRVDW